MGICWQGKVTGGLADWGIIANEFTSLERWIILSIELLESLSGDNHRRISVWFRASQ
jgi:hypothetical protein